MATFGRLSADHQTRESKHPIVLGAAVQKTTWNLRSCPKDPIHSKADGQ